MVETRPLPNQHLRHERERRGWSQQDVADKVGTTPLNVGRWERGITVPGPYFRQKLCEIFDKPVQELGLLPDYGEPEKTAAAPRQPAPSEEVITTFWNVPYGRNLFFTGREDILAQLNKAFLYKQPIAITQPQAISGLGGIGKTQTAVEYAYRYREQYEAVLWVRADSVELLNSDFLLIAALLNLPQRHEHDQDLVVKAVMRWLNVNERWLLILDNADHLESVSAYIPMAGKGHILLTTRAHSTGTIARRIELDTMDVQEGTVFLLRRAGLLPNSDYTLEAMAEPLRKQAQTLVEALDGLPLALDQAGAYIEETGCNLQDYLAFYRSRRRRLLRLRGENVTGHPEPVTTTWSLAFEKVERANPAAADLLRLCAFLHPDEIPEAMLIEGALELGPVLQPVVTDAFELNEAIGELRKYSLVKRDTEKKLVNIHRLVQAVVKDEMKEEEQQLWAQRAIRLVSKEFPDPRNWEFEDWLRCQTYMPHVQTCLDLVTQYEILSAETVRLLLHAGSYAIEQLYFQESEQLTQLALTRSEQMYGPNHPEIAHCLEQLAWISIRQPKGKSAEAESLYKRAIALYEEAFGSKHTATAECYNDLAILYFMQGRYDQAVQLIQHALSLREHLFGPDHPQVAQSLDNLAFIYYYEGNFEQAEEIERRCLAMNKDAGENPMLSGRYLGLLGLIYQEQGKYQQAEACFQESISLTKQVFGENHFYAVLEMIHLGRLYCDQGEYERAEALLQEAMEVYKQEMIRLDWSGENAFKDLAVLYYRQKKYEQAELLLHRALTDLQPELDIHIHAHEQRPIFFSVVVECLNTLALLYQDQGKYDMAEHYHQRALALLQQNLNSDDIFKKKREAEIQAFEARIQGIG